MKKRLLSTLLALCMVLALLPVTALAAESQWKLEMLGKSDAEVFVGKKTFTVRDWDCSYDQDEDRSTAIKTDSREYTVENVCVAAKGDVAVFTNGGESFTGFYVTAWSDPDGDGVYDHRLVDAQREDWILPADVAGPLHVEGFYYPCLAFFMPGFAPDGEYGAFDCVFSYTAQVTELKLPVDYLLEFFGPNTLVSVSEDESGWSCAILVEGDTAAPSEPSAPTTPPAGKVMLSPQSLTVDGEAVECEKYNIDDRNYFKLRDLASLLSGTGSQFEVGYDEDTATVSITTGQAYTPIGTELTAGVDNSASAQPSSQSILIDGEKCDTLTVYNIGGSNFFQLRELGNILGFEVDFDGDTNTAIVRSAQK